MKKVDKSISTLSIMRDLDTLLQRVRILCSSTGNAKQFPIEEQEMRRDFLFSRWKPDEKTGNLDCNTCKYLSH